MIQEGSRRIASINRVLLGVFVFLGLLIDDCLSDVFEDFWVSVGTHFTSGWHVFSIIAIGAHPLKNKYCQSYQLYTHEQNKNPWHHIKWLWNNTNQSYICAGNQQIDCDAYITFLCKIKKKYDTLPGILLLQKLPRCNLISFCKSLNSRIYVIKRPKVANYSTSQHMT